jgi:hypothetical protein
MFHLILLFIAEIIYSYLSSYMFNRNKSSLLSVDVNNRPDIEH